MEAVPFFCRTAQVLYEPQGRSGRNATGVREVKDEENGEINVEREPHTS